MQYFNLNYPKSKLFNIYLTGRFNSNQKGKTWDIDLIICYKNIINKNYEDIYDCLFFLYDNALREYLLLVDIIYVDYLLTFKRDFPNDIVSKNIVISDNYIQNIRKSEGENIIIFKKIIKKSRKGSFYQILNEKIDINNKKLYIINNDISYKSMIKKK